MQALRRFAYVLFCPLVLAATFVIAHDARAQTSDTSWPQRTVRFIVPLGAGSGVDLTARSIADKLAAKWGQPVVVENRPGGDAMLAITAALSAHDDRVLLFAPVSTFDAHPLSAQQVAIRSEGSHSARGQDTYCARRACRS